MEPEDLQPGQIVSRLRYLANEYREARKLPSLQAFEQCLRLDGQAEKIVAWAWVFNLLLGIKSLADQSRYSKGDDFSDFHSWCVGESAFNDLVGYHTFVADERKKVEYPDDPDYFEENEDGNNPKWLLPGLLGGMFSELRPINGGLFDDVDLFTARTQCSFEVMGYKAIACEIIAEYAEHEIERLAELETQEKQPVAPVVVPADPVADDGLCSTSRVLTWGDHLIDELNATGGAS